MSGYKTPTKSSSDIHIGGLAISARTTGASGSRQGSRSVVDQTPLKSQSKGSLLPESDTKLAARRNRILSAVVHCRRNDTYEGVVDDLGLSDKFEAFENSTPTLFKYLSTNAPAFVNNKMTPTTASVQVSRKQASETEEPKFTGVTGVTGEKAITAYFMELVRLMKNAVRERNKKLLARALQKLPECPYLLKDHQTTAIKDSKGHKADMVFFYNTTVLDINSAHIIVEAKREGGDKPIGGEILEQIADYQTSIWAAQPSRACVPVLLIRGTVLTLVVFTRDKWYDVPLGHICHNDSRIDSDDIESVRKTMVRLYFLLTLTPEEFGHYCSVFGERSYLSFAHISASSKEATIAVSTRRDPSAVKLGKHMKRAVHPRHRLAHIYEAEYGGKSVFLKLSWVPVDVVPEGAVYELLEQAGVDNIPKVFLSGVLVKNMFGYRLEFLVLEHCGSSIEEYLLPIIGESRCADPTLDKVRVVINGTLRCLAQAYALSAILHRDISMGNVRVNRSGQVKVIDWGYGKLLPVDGLSDEAIRHRGAVLAKWEFEGDAASTTNKPLTGTPYYMSIPVLSAATARGPMDEIESTFYVVLHALSTLESSKDPIVCAFDYHENRNLAMVRVGCLARESRFLEFFGVKNVSCELRQLLYKYRKYLFVDNGEYIAPDLVIDPYTPRGNNPELLSGYIDEETMDLLKQLKSA
ncbi:hypothetical protein IW146_000555 [Coemansia sp. RSA 922]|nr:hypothetical protein H4S03_002934 [Coemansia sp. S3946]KAJ2068885.1 hypothetical protein GGI08_000633 [Coemansia sp. S2]KAJ2117653.1 hypothetical protein IW146_000555 [Coemansia sp. RSA 922]